MPRCELSVSEEFFGIKSGHAAHSCRRHRLAVNLVGHIARREYAWNRRARATDFDEKIAI